MKNIVCCRCQNEIEGYGWYATGDSRFSGLCKDCVIARAIDDGYIARYCPINGHKDVYIALNPNDGTIDDVIAELHQLDSVITYLEFAMNYCEWIDAEDYQESRRDKMILDRHNEMWGTTL